MQLTGYISSLLKSCTHTHTHLCEDQTKTVLMGITYLHILQVSEGPHIKIRDILCSGAVIELTVAAADGLRVDSLCAAQRRRAVQTSHMRRRAKLCNAQETRHVMSQHACSQTLTPIKHTHK